eukprot:1842067-Rhodomonas_salina.1
MASSGIVAETRRLCKRDEARGGFKPYTDTVTAPERAYSGCCALVKRCSPKPSCSLNPFTIRPVLSCDSSLLAPSTDVPGYPGTVSCDSSNFQ